MRSTEKLKEEQNKKVWKNEIECDEGEIAGDGETFSELQECRTGTTEEKWKLVCTHAAVSAVAATDYKQIFSFHLHGTLLVINIVTANKYRFATEPIVAEHNQATLAWK